MKFIITVAVFVLVQSMTIQAESQDFQSTNDKLYNSDALNEWFTSEGRLSDDDIRPPSHRILRYKRTAYLTPKLLQTCQSISRTATDDWCTDNCQQGNCPSSHCLCTPLISSNIYVTKPVYGQTTYWNGHGKQGGLIGSTGYGSSSNYLGSSGYGSSGYGASGSGSSSNYLGSSGYGSSGYGASSGYSSSSNYGSSGSGSSSSYVKSSSNGLSGSNYIEPY